MKSLRNFCEDAIAAAPGSGYGVSDPGAIPGMGATTYPDVAQGPDDVFDLNYQKGSGDVIPFSKRKKPYEAKPSIMEMGEANVKPYKYKSKSYGDDKELISFVSDSGLEYTLILKATKDIPKTGYSSGTFLDISFEINSDDPFQETNRGEMFKVMSTVFKATKEYIVDRGDIDGIRYEPKETGGTGSLKSGDAGASRDRLYRIFIDKNMPSDYVKRDTYIFAIFK